jgi:IclR family KDG regulon transcriptional repressor
LKDKLFTKNQSVEKVFQIIEIMAKDNGPMRLQDISLKVKMPASTVMRLLNTLMLDKYVNQNSETLRYSLSLKFCQISDSIHSQFSIRDVVRPYLLELSEKCQESACLAIEEDMMLVYIDVAEGPDKMLRTMQRIGKSAPLHSTGIGKLLLLNYDDEKLKVLSEKKGLTQLTKNTITSIKPLKEELKNIASLGYAFDKEECEVGAKCIAAPIRDYTGKVIAGISVSGPISRITPKKIQFIVNILTDISVKISKKLGY